MVKAGRYPGDVFKVGRNRTLWATCLPNREIRFAHVDAVRVTDFPRRFTPKHSRYCRGIYPRPARAFSLFPNSKKSLTL